MPFVIHWTLDEYGFRATLRGWAIFVVRDRQFLEYYNHVRV
jgi:hypothetical protein